MSGQVDQPSVFANFYSPNTPVVGNDIIDLRVHLGCTKEVSSFEMLIQNWDKKYSPGQSLALNVGMLGNIFLGRGTGSIPQVIKARLEKLEFRSNPVENYLLVSGRCVGEQLFRRVVNRSYFNIKAELLVEDLIDNYTSLTHQLGSFPDFTTFTETDPNGRITVTKRRVYFTNLTRNEDAYVYKDYGAGGIGDFTWLVDIRILDAGSNWGMCATCVCSNEVDDFRGFYVNGKHAIGLLCLTDNASPRRQQIRIREIYNSTLYDSSALTFDMGKVLYCKFIRSGANLKLEVYAEPERKNKIAEASLTMQYNENFRYFFILNTWNSGTTEKISGAFVNSSLIALSDTTYTLLEYDNAKVWDILEFVAKTADFKGVIGYDFRVNPDGKFAFFPVGSKTASLSSLSELIEVVEYVKDIHRIRNKITVYGAASAFLPRNQDRWTEPTADPPPYWTAVTANTYVNRVSSDPTPQKGSYCVKVTGTGTGTQNAEVYATITGEDGNPKTLSLDSSKKLRFYLWIPHAMMIRLKLHAPDENNCFRTQPSINSGGGAAGWYAREIPLGKENEYSNDNPNGYWERVGNPDWKRVTRIGFYTTWVPGDTRAFAIDWMYFDKMPFEATVEDAASQSAYGLRELVETDDELTSDAECLLRANALLAYLKDPAEYLTVRSSVIDYGMNPLLPGDVTHVTLPNENIDADFRIISVDYHFNARTQMLDITLELGKEPPLLADYLYALKAKTDTLARTKMSR